MRVFPDGDLNLADHLDMQQLLVQEQSDRLQRIQQQILVPSPAKAREAMLILSREPKEDERG